MQKCASWKNSKAGGPCKAVSAGVGKAERSKHTRYAKQPLEEGLSTNQQDPEEKIARSRFNKVDS